MKKIIKSEDDVKKKIIKPWYEKAKAWFFMQVPRGMGKAGVPDYVGCVPITITQEMVGKRIGLFVAIEAKRPSKRHAKDNGASGMQIVQMREIDEAHGVTGIVGCAWDMAHMQWRLNRILKGEDV